MDETPRQTVTLLLVRHGETAWNREKRLQGWQNVPLSATGEEQARLLAHRLVRTWEANRKADATDAASALLPGPPSAFYASDLSRAVETARAVADAIVPLTGGAVLPVQPMEALRERNFGEREGHTAEEARAKWGSAASHHDVGESYAQVYVRMINALQTIWNAHAAPEGEGQTPLVLVAGHGGSLRLWLCRAAGLGPHAVQAFHLDNTGLCVVTFTGPTFEQSKGRILLCNDTAHLQNFAPNSHD